MNRRNFSLTCLGALAAAGAAGVGIVPAAAAPGNDKPNSAAREPGKRHIAFVLFEGLTAQDMIGPATVLTASGQFTVDYVWRDRNSVFAESRVGARLGLLPTATFADLQAADILCVPGTSNPYAQIRQQDMVEWVARIGEKASWVTSVCTGSFILGAAGLLKGYKATSHWASIDQLAFFGAIPTHERVVHDRNRVTGAGVTSGLDFGLSLLAKLCGDEVAKTTQLTLEYDPAPPFACGSPRTAPPDMVDQVRSGYQASLAKSAPYARESLEAAAKRLDVAVRP